MTFITVSGHNCLQHVCRYAECRVFPLRQLNLFLCSAVIAVKPTECIRAPKGVGNSYELTALSNNYTREPK